MRLTSFFTALFLVMVPPAIGLAGDNPFAPRLIVNDRAITNYEVDQRTKFMQVLNSPGDLETQPLKDLINDRIRLDEAKKLGITISDDQIKAGEAEFAGRAKLSAEEFEAEIAKGGVDASTFRDFVKAGQAWREVIRRKFIGDLAVTDADIAAAKDASLLRASLKVLLSELILPATPEYIGQTKPLADQLAKTLRSASDFAGAARQYSASSTAQKGGELDWMPLANLPAAIGDRIRVMHAGQIIGPIQVPNAFAFFLLRGVQEDKTQKDISISVDYAEYLIPGGNSAAALATAAQVRARVDACNDLYAINKGQPADRLIRETRPADKLPSDVGLQLAKMDPGESSTALTSNGNLVFLMLCSRDVVRNPEPTKEELVNQIINERVNALADNYLDELRANAIIRQP